MNKSKSLIWQIPREELEKAVKDSSCFADLSRIYYGKETNTRTLKKRILKDGIDTSHFVGRMKFKGLKRPENSHPHYSLQELLTVNSEHKINNSKLKEKLVNTNTLFNECYICGLREWQGQPITLQLVHLNKDSFDNRLDNLVLLCPNCFSQAKSGLTLTLNECKCGVKIPKSEKACGECGKNGKNFTPSFGRERSESLKKPSKGRLQKELISLGFEGVEKRYRVDRDTIIEWINGE